MIRLTIPSIDEDDSLAVREALMSGFLVQGRRVAEFETEVAKYVGVNHAVAVSNGTAALHVALLALDVKPGNLVLVTSYSWPATANVIELCGAEPVFIDIDRRTFNMDPELLERRIRALRSNSATASRLKAVLPVHTFGQLADMPAIMEIANRFDLPVIEDAACALGARLNERQAGTWGVMGCFSFHPRKAITTGEGGIVTTNDPKLATHLRMLRNHGQDPNSPSPDFVAVGFNYRMTEFQAALGCSQMRKLDRVIAARQRCAASYDRKLEGTPIRAPFATKAGVHVYQSYVVTIPEEVSGSRANIIRDLKDQGIETTLGTWHLPMTSYFRNRYGFKLGDFPETDRAFSDSLSLPLYEGLSEQDQQSVISELVTQLQKYTSVNAR